MSEISLHKHFKEINDFLTSLFMFRYHYLNNIPKYFTNYYVTNNKVYDHNTRNASKLHKSYSRTNYVKHSLCNNGVDIWNKLTPDLKNTKEIQKLFLAVAYRNVNAIETLFHICQCMHVCSHKNLCSKLFLLYISSLLFEIL